MTLGHGSVSAEGRKVIVDRVVASVDDAIILNSELMVRTAPLASELSRITDTAERKRRRETLKARVLTEMINEELVLKAALAAKLDVNATEVKNAMDEIKRQNGLDDDQFADALKVQGYTLEAYRRDVRRQILRMRAIQSLVRPKVNVGDEDVKAQYAKTTGQAAGVSRVKLHHVLIRLPDTPTKADLEKARARAARIIEASKNGETFASLAAKHSDDAASKDSGGELGWFERNSLATEWEEVVFAMDKGDVRGPITGPQGLHVFHVSDQERGSQKKFEEVKEQLRTSLFRQETERQTRIWLDALRKQAHIQNRL